MRKLFASLLASTPIGKLFSAEKSWLKRERTTVKSIIKDGFIENVSESERQVLSWAFEWAKSVIRWLKIVCERLDNSQGWQTFAINILCVFLAKYDWLSHVSLEGSKKQAANFKFISSLASICANQNQNQSRAIKWFCSLQSPCCLSRKQHPKCLFI